MSAKEIREEEELVIMRIYKTRSYLSLYDEVWIEYRNKNNLTDDQLYALEQNSINGIIPEIKQKLPEDLMICANNISVTTKPHSGFLLIIIGNKHR